jgi:hypothetical protein
MMAYIESVMSKSKEMADFIRATCRSLGSPVPKEMSDLEVLQFALELVTDHEKNEQDQISRVD